MDKATFQLAESYDALKKKYEQATKAKMAAQAAEEVRRLESLKKIEALADVERRSVQELGKAGTARAQILATLPSDIAQALSRVEADIRQHQEPLESAKRILKVQQEHHEESMEKLAPLLRLDPKNPMRPGAEVEKKQLEAALDGCKRRLAEETERTAKLQAQLAKLEAARDEFLKELREKAMEEAAGAK